MTIATPLSYATDRGFLPHSISDTFHSTDEISAWLRSIGEKIVAVERRDRYQRVLTASHFYVYRNGYVSSARGEGGLPARKESDQ